MNATKERESATPNMDKKTFLTKLSDAAKPLSLRSGIPVAIIATEAAHESNYGNSFLSKKGNNLFGIKAGDTWKGEILELPTTEFINGKEIKTVAKFRKYPTYESSLTDWLNFLNKPRYAAALAFAKMGDATQFFKALQNAGYATDPKYSDKLAGVYNVVRAEVV